MLSESSLERFSRSIWPDLGEKPATAMKQAIFGLSRILPILKRLDRTDCRILEVGAGRMLLSAYLAAEGFRVTALEPLTPDFSWYDALQADVLAYCARKTITFEHVHTMVEDYIAPSRYDLVFSIHVLEHVRDPLRALENMYLSLKERGSLLALCPNYDVPFEPHLGILLLGRSKVVNAKLYPRRIAARSELWDRLVFVRYSTFRRFLERKRIRYSFNRMMLRDMFLELGKDELLYGRMPRALRWAYHILDLTGAIGLLSKMPLRVQTPMELLITK